MGQTEIRIDHYIHGGSDDEILRAVRRIEQRVIAGGFQMTQFADDVRTEFGRINQFTTDLQGDINELLDKVAQAPSQEERTALLDELRQRTEALGQVASAYPPVPVDTGAGGANDGGAEVPGTTPIEEPAPTEGGTPA